MSWFQDLAGKAENILNKIDQNAASVLQQKLEKDEQQQVLVDSVDKQQLSYIINLTAENENVSTPIKQTSLGRSPLKLEPTTTELTTTTAIDPTNLKEDKQPIIIPSTSTSRRTSVSSKAEGTVIEANKCILPTTVDHEFLAIKIVLNEIKTERDQLKGDLEQLREQIKNENSAFIIKELEIHCQQLKIQLDEKRQRQEALENTNADYMKTISDLERKLSALQTTESDLLIKLDWAKKEAEQATDELHQYRSRAQSTLQMKERLIEQLKCDNKSYNKIDDTDISAIELEHYKSEKLSLLEEIRIQNDQLQQIRCYVDKLETVQKDQQLEFEQKFALVTAKFKNEEKKWIQFEQENKSQVSELSMVRDEMQRLQTEYTNKIHQKEIELSKLRTQISQQKSIKPVSLPSSGLEQRVQSLTQSLVHKQNSLESVTADRNALRLQLEQIEQQHRQTMIQLRQQRPQVINLNDTDDAKAQVPMFLQENPFDTGVARRVKRAYSTLDSAGVRLGQLLRRYPLIRILCIFYVVLLHLWVMVVLFTSTPN